MKDIEKIIEECFIHQIQNIGYKNINIKTLTAEAHINRTTFYDYFDSKKELATRICDRFIDEYASLIVNDFENIDDDTFIDSLIVSLNYLKKNRNTILALWNIEEDYLSPYLIMQQKYYEIIRKQIDKTSNASKLNKDIFALSVSGAAMATNRYYLENDHENTMDFARAIVTGIKKGDLSILKIK